MPQGLLWNGAGIFSRVLRFNQLKRIRGGYILTVMPSLTHIDLFSGIGGFALAAQWAGFQTVAFVEIEKCAQEIIKQNFGAVADADCGRLIGSSESAQNKSDGNYIHDSRE